MRLTTAALLLLPGASLAQQQQPLLATARGWLDRAKAYLPDALVSPSATASAIYTAATSRATQAAAARAVVPLTASNWQTALAPQAAPQAWLVLVTGGNKTCAGRCGPLDAAFAGAAAALAADPRAPRLARLDCDDRAAAPACTAWWASPPSVWHVARPSQGEMAAARQREGLDAPTHIHRTWINATTVTAQQVRDLHAKERYREGSLVEGYFHPFDGILARYGALPAFGYAADALGRVPPFVLMIALSFITRQMMSNRLGAQQQPGQQQQRRRPDPPLGGAPPANEGYPPETK